MRQGEIYWLRFQGKGSETSGRRPAVVVQHDRFNRSAIQTTLVPPSSNLMLAAMPGMRLRRGEANLPRRASST
jgi:mRNA-degrading endonuclease toxin of MazEF toxin-antitoxin module